MDVDQQDMDVYYNDFINKYKEIQEKLLNYVDQQDIQGIDFHNFLLSIQEKKIQDDKHEFSLLLHFITSISDNHYRNSNFFEKIDLLLDNFREVIKKYFSNKEIFSIFKSNKRILLFLFEQKIVNFDENILNLISTEEYSKKSYLQYFQPEIDSKAPLPENFENDRKRGENEHYISTLIQKDLVKDFIVFVNKNNYFLKSKIEPSIYETNSFLLENEPPTLIEYSAFYGSIQIFNYLRANGVELTSSLWPFAIHGRVPEIIHILEENKIQPEKEILIDMDIYPYQSEYEKIQKVISYEECYLKSIQFHHNEIKEYIEINYSDTDYNQFQFHHNEIKEYIEINYSDTDYNQFQFHHNEIKEYIENNYSDTDYNQFQFNEDMSLSDKCSIQAIKYYNFKCFDEYMIRKRDDFFNEFCKYDYYTLIKMLLIEADINIYNMFLPSYEEKTPLIIAIEEDNLDLVQLFFSDEKIDVNYSFDRTIKNDYGRYHENVTPFYWAVEKGNLEVIKLFLKHEELDINRLNDVFYLNKQEGGTENEEEDDDDCDDDYKPRESSHELYEPLNNPEEFKDPLRITIKTDKKTPFYLAVEKGNIEIIQLLLENKNIDINIQNKLKTKTKERYEKFRKYMRGNTLHWTVNTDKEETKTAFYLAVEKGNLEIIKILLANEKVDVNIINEFHTLIHDEKDMYEDYTDSEIQDTNESESKTALYYAVENEKLEILNLLLANKRIDVNLACKSDEYYKLAYVCENRMEHTYEFEKTPFYLAVEYKNIEIIKLLLQNVNIDINQKYTKSDVVNKYDREGIECDKKECKIMKSPLHLAVYNQNIDIIKILLAQKNIDLDSKDNDGKTPIELTNDEQILNLFNK